MVKLNIGGGKFHQEGWLNLDFPFPARERKMNFEYIDINHNLMSQTPIPLKDNSVHVIYTEHCIEHLTDNAVIYLLKDIHRLLIPCGILRISCPDIDVLYNEYMGKDPNNVLDGDEFLEWFASPLVNKYDNHNIDWIFANYGKQKGLDYFTSDVKNTDLLVQFVHPGYHLSWWNFEKLNSHLSGIGFKNIVTMQRNQSICKDLTKKYIDKTDPHHSIRIECIK